jgi:hypothetical protein
MNLVLIHLDICLYREWTMMMMRMPNKHWMHMDNADVVLVAVAVAVVRSASVYSEGVKGLVLMQTQMLMWLDACAVR